MLIQTKGLFIYSTCIFWVYIFRNMFFKVLNIYLCISEGKLDPNLIGINVTEEAVSAESSSDEFEVRRGRTRAHLPGFTLLTFPMDDADNQAQYIY